MVWQDTRNGNFDIWGKDLATGREFDICIDPASQDSPRISGDLVVWEDARHASKDIYARNLGTGIEFSVCSDGADQDHADVDGQIVVWQDSRVCEVFFWRDASPLFIVTYEPQPIGA